MSLKHKDLVGTIVPEISIDKYIPKAGKEEDVIVVAFFCTDEEPAVDLNRFIQRGSVEILTSEVSTNTDDDGNYLVFVEMVRGPDFFNQFKALVKDVQNVAGEIDWKVFTEYTGDESFAYDDVRIGVEVIDTSVAYRVWKRANKKLAEAVVDVLDETHLAGFVIDGNVITINGTRGAVSGEIIDVFEDDDLLDQTGILNEKAIIFNTGSEFKMLENILGNTQVHRYGTKALIINEAYKCLILDNLYIKY